ncbi:DUF1566 domain-containing protein, partial [candidate division KSB1 bacterium]|nr:DUF1566 domain-containing protein [candidate division KSB1 bacterium]
KKYDFYDRGYNPKGIGIGNKFKLMKNSNIVIDDKTDLIWQRSGSTKPLYSHQIKDYIKLLNQEKFAGFNDWRLPTLEEAMSLMIEAARNYNDIYIDSLFDENIKYIWTADWSSESGYWYVNFAYGDCNDRFQDGVKRYVRAVRSK